jgi:S-adenosylmethionine:tRNA ribosyltransferase-isomerase
MFHHTDSQSVKTDQFDYDLPEALIAQHPARRRDESRLLVVDRATRTIEHRRFGDLSSLLRAGDLLIRNTARVLPARIHARKSTGGKVECLLLYPAADANTWSTLLRPGRRLKAGTRFGVTDQFQAEVIGKKPSGEYLVRFTENRHGSVPDLAEAIGEMPLPPYVDRLEGTVKDRLEDRERYQTVYARADRTVAAAAPTAGLHFTSKIDRELRVRGIETAEIVLHVGLGTFRPIETDEIEAHHMHAETYEIPAETRSILADSGNRRKIAVGTTSLRALEAFHQSVDQLKGPDHIARTDLFITPPASFKQVDGLLTNFHLPRSTLLCLLAAFLTPGSVDGTVWFKEIYAEAVREDYRFLSYGDAMLVL